VADPWTQDTVEAVLAGYEALKAHTQFIAAVVYNVRYPRDATQQFELEFDLEFGRVYVNYYYRQNHHQLTFPLAYVWADMEDIRPLETDRVAAERQAD
jgi:hypothetical protein